MRLGEIREARNITQDTLAERLKLKQSAVSRMEHKPDMYISTLQNYVAGVGAELIIEAVFPDQERMEIDQFERRTKAGKTKRTR